MAATRAPPGHPWAAIFGLTPIALVRSGQAEDAAETRQLAGWEEAHGSSAHRGQRLHARLQREREKNDEPKDFLLNFN